MLEAGLAAMKQQAYGLYRVVCFRWIEETPLGKTLRYLGLDKGAYYRRCGYAIDFLYLHINGYYGKLDPFLSKIRQKATKCID
jgi:hypothetical protein